MAYRFSKNGFSLAEIMIGSGLLALALILAARLMTESSKQSALAARRANLQSDFALMIKSVQKLMSTNLRLLAASTGPSSQLDGVRMLIPLFNTCRNLSACTGATSILYANAAKETPWQLLNSEAQAGGSYLLSFNVAQLADLTAKLKVNDIIGILNTPNTLLYRLTSNPASMGGFAKFQVRPLLIPATWVTNTNNATSTSNFNPASGGSQILRIETFILGPLNTPSPNLGTRKCSHNGTQFLCSSTDITTVNIHRIQDFQAAAQFIRPFFATGACSSIDIFYDVGSSNSQTPLCSQNTNDSAIRRFERASANPVNNIAKVAEHPGDIENKEFSMKKLHLLSMLRFGIKLARPDTGKPESGDNRTREVFFYVKF